MPRLARRELQTVIERLPHAEPVSNLQGSFDLFVAALGFEDRCPALARELAPRCSVEAALIAEYSANRRENELQREPLTAALRALDCTIQFESTDSGQFFDALKREITAALEANTEPRVLVDLSSMVGSLIVGIVRVVMSFDEVDLTIGYTPARQYGPSREDFERSTAQPVENLGDGHGGALLIMDHGVSAIQYSVDFQGSHVPGLDDLVLILPGFGGDRVRAAISYVNPAYLHAPGGHVKWVLGVPSRPDLEWRTEAMVRANRIPPEDVVGRVKETEYTDVIRVLDSVFRRVQFQDNVTVVPLATKLQTLGVALHCVVRPSIRILLADPSQYRADAYSSGSDEPVVIRFGQVGVLRASLSSVDCLVVDDDD